MDRAGPQRTAIDRLTVYSMLNLIRGGMALAGLRHVHMRMHMWGDIEKKRISIMRISGYVPSCSL